MKPGDVGTWADGLSPLVLYEAVLAVKASVIWGLDGESRSCRRLFESGPWIKSINRAGQYESLAMISSTYACTCTYIHVYTYTQIHVWFNIPSKTPFVTGQGFVVFLPPSPPCRYIL